PFSHKNLSLLGRRRKMDAVGTRSNAVRLRKTGELTYATSKRKGASMASKGICPSCGFQQNPPNATRCASCGSKLETLGRTHRTREEELERRYQQEGVNIRWMTIALAVQTVLTAALVFGLPMVIPAIDFEGGNGMTVCIPVW